MSPIQVTASRCSLEITILFTRLKTTIPHTIIDPPRLPWYCQFRDYLAMAVDYSLLLSSY